MGAPIILDGVPVHPDCWCSQVYSRKSHIPREFHVPTSPIFAHVARGHSSVLLWWCFDVMYLSVLWMTSCFHIMGSMACHTYNSTTVPPRPKITIFLALLTHCYCFSSSITVPIKFSHEAWERSFAMGLLKARLLMVFWCNVGANSGPLLHCGP